jgi:hypothetical protein
MFAFIVVSVAAPVNPINCKNVRRLVLLIRNLLSIKLVHATETGAALTPPGKLCGYL